MNRYLLISSVAAILISAFTKPALSQTPTAPVAKLPSTYSALEQALPVSTPDTVACVFRQVAPQHQPAVLWRSGFIVLPKGQINVNKVWYPVSQAATLTGPISNQFLATDKKTPVQAVIIQVILL